MKTELKCDNAHQLVSWDIQKITHEWKYFDFIQNDSDQVAQD